MQAILHLAESPMFNATRRLLTSDQGPFVLLFGLLFFTLLGPMVLALYFSHVSRTSSRRYGPNERHEDRYESQVWILGTDGSLKEKKEKWESESDIDPEEDLREDCSNAGLKV